MQYPNLLNITKVGGAWSRGRRALFPFDQIFQKTLYVQNILYGGIR